MLDRESSADGVDRVHGLVARCLSEPTFLDAARANPPPPVGSDAARARATLGAATLARLALFRGHITRVQNNALRRHIPHTLRLMERLGLDLPFFSAISAEWVQARREGAFNLERHLDFFASALRSFVAGASGGGALLDCLEHERLLGAAPWPGPAPGAGVRFRGQVQVRRYSSDPLEWCGAADWQTAALPPLAASGPGPGPTETLLAYHRLEHGSEGATAVFVVDLETALLLTAVDGRRTLAALVEHVTARAGGAFDQARAVEAYRQLAREGLIDRQTITSSAPPSDQEVSACASSS